MTTKEGEKALKCYNSLRDLLFYHGDNLTKQQQKILYDIKDNLRELSNKAYYLKK